jgi:hypothetical protein
MEKKIEQRPFCRRHIAVIEIALEENAESERVPRPEQGQ